MQGYYVARICDCIVFLIVLFFNDPFVVSIMYNTHNVTDVFKYFKEKYNKEYYNDTEESMAMHNFAMNLNKVSQLNEETTDRDTFYIINQYADLDPQELSDNFAVNVKPYFKVSNTNDAENLGRQRYGNVKISELYDLDNAEDMYKKYVVKYKKKNASKTFDRQVHFYRFVKTLVELNNKHFLGEDNAELDEKADVLKEPYEYFWDE